MALKEITDPRTLAGKSIDKRLAIMIRLNKEIERGDSTLKVLDRMLINYLINSMP